MDYNGAQDIRTNDYEVDAAAAAAAPVDVVFCEWQGMRTRCVFVPVSFPHHRDALRSMHRANEIR